jgi:stage III sporulation protein AB
MDMLRLTGCLIVISISVAIGNLLAKGYSNRVRNLLDFITVLNIFYTKIRYGQETIGNIFLDVRREIKRDINKIFYEVGTRFDTSEEPVDKIWNDVIEKNFRDLDLNFEDERILLDFGTSLGRSDIEGQLRNIEMTIEKLKSQLIGARDLRDKYGKIYKTVGTLGGVALAIILI